MIAFLFWHVPRTGADEAVYTARLARFQEELKALGNAGLCADPAAFRMDDVPWINAGRTVYLDVYAMADTSKMDILDKAAVSGSMTQPHAEIAALYGSGAGSLYDVRKGDLGPAIIKHSYWFSKPAGMSYADLDAALEVITTEGSSVLRRKMVLGPSPEFVLFSPAPEQLPEPIVAAHRVLTSI